MAQRGVNKVILVGNVGQDPEVKSTQSGSMIANLSIATSETWKDKNTGNQEERTEWHRVVFFGKLAEIISQYVSRGSKLYIEGQLRTRKWQDNSGQDRYTTEIVGSEMQMLDGKSSSGGQYEQGHSRPQPPPVAPPPSNTGVNDFDDDIPF